MGQIHPVPIGTSSGIPSVMYLLILSVDKVQISFKSSDQEGAILVPGDNIPKCLRKLGLALIHTEELCILAGIC